MRKEKGFTLVELLIVVAIIGILAAIAIPQFNKYKIRGYVASLKSDLKNAHTAANAYLTDYPNEKIVQQNQLERGGWKPTANIGTQFVNSGSMSLSGGHITLKTGRVLNSSNVDYPNNKVVDGYTFTAQADENGAEGQVNYNGVIFAPLVK